MPVENGRSCRLPVNQVGRGHEPVTVVGRTRSLVAVSTGLLLVRRLLRLEDYAAGRTVAARGSRRREWTLGRIKWSLLARWSTSRDAQPLLNSTVLTSERVNSYGTALGAEHVARPGHGEGSRFERSTVRWPLGKGLRCTFGYSEVRGVWLPPLCSCSPACS